MNNVLDRKFRASEALLFKVHKFDCEGFSRYLLVNSLTYTPSISASIYEASYMLSAKRHKASISTMFHHLTYMFSWAADFEIDIEGLLLTGEGVSATNIKRLGVWVEDMVARRSSGLEFSNYPGKILKSCSLFVRWFVFRFLDIDRSAFCNVGLVQIIEAHKKCWENIIFIEKKEVIASDMTDTEIAEVDNYFHSLKCSDLYADCTARNYLMWRLAISFGLRIGELLALRLEDLELVGPDPCIDIVHLNERGSNYRDPRAPYHPRVKTLSRRLYFKGRSLDVVALIELYLEQHRHIVRMVNGKLVLSSFLGHGFLFIEHGSNGSGRPLSYSAATRIACAVRDNTSVSFHWHLVRHAFFNRLYSAAAELPENVTEIDHIVYVGGWKNPDSLKIYSNRARRDRGRDVLIKRNDEAQNI